jgi:CBS domain-containing protein
MLFTDLLDPDRVVVPLEAPTLEEALFQLLGRLPEATRLTAPAREKVAAELARGDRGEVVYLQHEVVAIFAEREGLTGTLVLAGVGSAPFEVVVKGREEPDRARVILLFLVPGKATSIRARMAPTLRSFLARDGVVDAMTNATTPQEFLQAPWLDAVRFAEHAQVSEAVEVARYRVYPESPAGELLDLMIRRRLTAVPVVGEGYEVLGVVTSEDALRHLLAAERRGEGEGLTARDVMTRQVLCVSEDQDLRDVAQLMVSRGAAQLPVVREGQFVGFVTRDSALAALGGRGSEGPE